MKFLNKKEQVIDLEITPYGKSLLSIGKFHPEFYAFYDNDILYDSQYGGVSEVQNSSSVRIKDSPQLETQIYLYSPSDRVRQDVNSGLFGSGLPQGAHLRPGGMNVLRQYQQHVSRKDDNLASNDIDKNPGIAPLGNSSIDTSKLPAWNIKVLRGEISSSSQTYSVLNNDYKIPQLNMDNIECVMKMSDDVESDNYYVFASSDIELNGKVLNFMTDSIVLEIDEDNTDFQLENFDIEVFEVLTGTINNQSRETLQSLYFQQQASLMKNDILLDPNEVEQIYKPLDPNYSDYFISILADRDISERELCELSPENRPLGIFSKRVLECDELLDDEIENIENLYDTEEFNGECE